ncbi:MAG: response regulator, partial [bacterium]|nr:response regulator [bacterium]
MGAKLLLADDSVTIQKVVELTLADEEYDIVMVSDGASAFQKAEEMSPDLILADIVMPELNGYELCEKVRGTPALSETPVLLLSSTFETYDETRGQSVGANDHIIKPFESEELTRKIKNLLTQKEPAAESAAVPQAAAAAGDAGGTTEFSLETPGLLGSDAVEEDGFEFELTDEFMDQAEEMFEDTGETSEYEVGETLPELEELSEEGSLEELDVAMTAEGVTDILNDADETDAVSGLADHGISSEDPGTLKQTMGTGIFPGSLGPE